jgi:4-amino-4-deoxy-L-arabinose transferase-like glycosyltransferase
MPFWEKPPLFFWLQIISMKIWGINEFASRLPNAICGIVTLLVIFRIGRHLYTERFGILWALVYFGSILPNFYFRSGIIDPWFNLFTFLGIYYFILFHWKKDGLPDISLPKTYWNYLIISAFYLGLAVLTKGPAAYLIAALCFGVYWIMQGFRWYISFWQAVAFTAMTAFLTLSWYGIEVIINGPWFLVEFVKYQYRLFSTPDAGHGGFPGYHFVVLLLGCFPASVFMLRAFAKQEHDHAYQANFKKWMLILFWVVLILFSIVKSKIVHYSSLCYFPLTYLAALVIYQMEEGKLQMAKWAKALLILLGVLLSMVLITLPLLAQRIEWVQSLIINDPFARANLDAEVVWYGWEAIAGLVLLASVVMGVFLLNKQERVSRAICWLFMGTATSVLLVMYLYMPKIEPYTQGAAIEFFKSLEGKDCYVHTYAYKSYANLFYPKTQPDTKPRLDGEEWEQWLLYGDTDKDVYVSSKVMNEEKLDQIPNLQKLYAKNGFVFYFRPKP